MPDYTNICQSELGNENRILIGDVIKGKRGKLLFVLVTGSRLYNRPVLLLAILFDISNKFTPTDTPHPLVTGSLFQIDDKC